MESTGHNGANTYRDKNFRRLQMSEDTTSSSFVTVQQEMSLGQISFSIEWQHLGTTYPNKSLSNHQLTLSRVN